MDLTGKQQALLKEAYVIWKEQYIDPEPCYRPVPIKPGFHMVARALERRGLVSLWGAHS